MGQIFDRLGSGRSGHDGEDEAAENRYVYPPKNGAPYFASHFIMGGDKFDSPCPESYLFGENSDLNYLGGKPVTFPYPPPQGNEPTRTLRGLVNIRRDSVHFVQIPKAEIETQDIQENDENEQENDHETRQYNIEFTFDCDVRCAFTIFYFCTEESHSSGINYISSRPHLTSETYEYKRGSDQVFKQPLHIFRPYDHLEELEQSSRDCEYIHCAIQCVALDGDNPKQSHATLCSIERHISDTGYSLKPIKQKLFVDGLYYLMQEIYGLENKMDPLREQSDDDDIDDCGAECVVCMSELRDTIILPCRHLCLCQSCADCLRYQANNCPICRAPFRALLQIRVVQKIGHTAHPALADQDRTQEGVPQGYKGISLIEALNGPLSVAPPPPPPIQSLPASTGDKKSRRSKSGHNKRSKNSRSATSSAQSSSRRETPGSIEGQPSTSSSVLNSEISDQRSESVTSPPQIASSSGPSSNVSVNYINELNDSRISPKTPVSKSNDTPSDLVDQELAKIAMAESLNDVAVPPEENSVIENENNSESHVEVCKEGETVVINLTGAATSRVSAPGTPTSMLSLGHYRSSQDSGSSNNSQSSTKPLLDQKSSRKSSIETTSISESSSNATTTTGSAIIVRVHPMSNSEMSNENSPPNSNEEAEEIKKDII